MKSITIKIMLGLFLAVTVPMALVFGFLFRAFYTQTVGQRIDAITREINQLDNAMTIFMDQGKENVVLLADSPLLRRVSATKEVGEAVSGIQHGVGGTPGGMDRTREVVAELARQTEALRELIASLEEERGGGAVRALGM